MATYFKKPEVVNAVQWTGENYDDVRDFCRCEVIFDSFNHCIYIQALENDVRVDDGDFIIRGEHGQFYPCKPNVFKETYEA